jgi:Asp-tRNA(Asn)/Glu-tRNA(Gln) amidotransferase A subunit family amidase
MARTVMDAALLLEAISGHDPADCTSARRPVPAYSRLVDGGVKGLRLGVPAELFWDPIHPEVESRARAAIRVLEEAGAEIRDVSLPCMEYAPAAQAPIICAEAAAYHRPFLRVRSEEYGPGVRMRLLQGLFVTSADYLDAQRARRLVRREFLERLKEVDALVMPTVPIPAPRVGEDTTPAASVPAPTQYYLVRNTFIFNLTGFPAVSVPCGLADGLPVGLQIAGRPWDEATVLRIARVVEEAGASATAP